MKNFYNGKLFHMASYFRRTEKLEILNVTTYWPGGSVVAPLGRPECGFNGEFCPPPGRYNIIAPAGISPRDEIPRRHPRNSRVY